MKLGKAKMYAPITITLETEEEAKELLGILQKVDSGVSRKEGDVPGAFRNLRESLHNELGFPMTGLYYGELTRSGS